MEGRECVLKNRTQKNSKIPVVLWRDLSTREAAQYYLFTKLFGMRLNRDVFYHKFGIDIHHILFPEVVLFKAVKNSFISVLT